MTPGKFLRLPKDPGSRDLLGLCFIAGFAFFSWTMAAPLVPLLLLDLNASPGLLGTVISVSMIGSLLSAVPGGWLAGRWGTRRLLLRSALLSAASSLFLALFPTIAGLFVGLAFLEIAKILFIVGAQAHVSNLGEGRDLNLDFGWYGMASAVGQLLGPIVAGAVLDNAGHFAAWIIITLLMVVVVFSVPRLLSLEDDLEAKAPAAAEKKEKKGLGYYLNSYAIIAILSSFAVIFADGARTTFFPVLMKGFGYSATVIGFFMSLRALVSMSVRLVMKRLIAFLGGRFPRLIVSIFIMAAGIGMTPFCRGWLSLSLNAALVGIGIGMALPLSMATVSEGVAPEDRGVAMGIRLTGNRLAQFVNPIFFGLLTESFGLSLSFLAGGGLLFFTSVPILFWWKGESKRRASPAESG